jgi:anti-sigma B factor antagonist
MKNLNITERRNNSIVILDLEGNIRLGEGSRELHNAIRGLVDRGEKKILLNLANVSYIDSSGLGELVGGYTTLQKNAGELKLLHLTQRITELMTITKLLTVFDVYENEEEAINSFPTSSENVETEQSGYDTGKLNKAAVNL